MALVASSASPGTDPPDGDAVVDQTAHGLVDRISTLFNYVNGLLPRAVDYIFKQAARYDNAHYGIKTAAQLRCIEKIYCADHPADCADGHPFGTVIALLDIDQYACPPSEPLDQNGDNPIERRVIVHAEPAVAAAA